MRIDTADENMTSYQDEFDVYFARAKMDEKLIKEQQEAERNNSSSNNNNRRGSLPDEPVIPVFLEVQPHHRRALSCKLPARKKSRKASSSSPRDSPTPPPAQSQDTSTVPLIHHSHQHNNVTICYDNNNHRIINTTENNSHEKQPEDINSDDSADNEMQGISMNYVTEATLRAPSPRMGGGNSPRCHSAPHSRSSSWKNQRRPSNSLRSGRSSLRNTDSPSDLDARSRKSSITQFEEEVTQKLEQLKLLQAEDVCVVRNFSTSSRGLINRGDSFKRKPRSSTASVSSDVKNTISSACGDVMEPQASSAPKEHFAGTGGSTSTGHTAIAMAAPVVHKVLVIGDRGVGKTALLQQFMTSHYMGAAETSFDDEIEKTLTVLSDGEETMIDFIEVPVEQDVSQYGSVDGYVLCFSITSKPSFHYMKEVLENINKSSETQHLAKIVVANKSDLVRKRQVAENDSRAAAIKNGCKYAEVSAAINHKVDDLLVGVTTQIRLNPQRKEVKKAEGPRTTSCVSAKGLMQLIFKRNTLASTSCDNLLKL